MLSYTPPPPTMDLNNAIVGSSITQVVTSRESAEYSGDNSLVDEEVHAPEAKKAKKGNDVSFLVSYKFIHSIFSFSILRSCFSHYIFHVWG
jgi:hypothetical protein